MLLIWNDCLFVVRLQRCSLSSSTKRRAGNKTNKKRLVNGYGLHTFEMLIQLFITERKYQILDFSCCSPGFVNSVSFLLFWLLSRIFWFLFVHLLQSHTKLLALCLQLVTFTAAGHLAILLCWKGNEVKLQLFVPRLVLLLCKHSTTTNFKEPSWFIHPNLVWTLVSNGALLLRSLLLSAKPWLRGRKSCTHQSPT